MNIKENFKCIYTNCDSLLNKKDELFSRICLERPDFIFLTEMIPKNYLFDVDLENFCFEGYNLFFAKNSRRGTGIYVKKDISVSEVFINDCIESVWVHLKLPSEESLLIGCVYRSPNCTSDNNELLKDLLRKADRFNADHLLVVGDFNHKYINWSSLEVPSDKLSREFLEIIDDLFWIQHCVEPTRIRKAEEPSVLDLIFTKDESLISDLCYQPALGLSDHLVLTFNVDCSIEVQEPIMVRNYYKGNFDGMRNYLASLNLIQLCDKMSGIECAEFIEQLLKDCVDRFVPLKLKSNNIKKEWINRDIEDIIKLKHKAWNVYQNKRDGKSWEDFVKVRNRTTTEIRNAKASLEKKLATEVKSNPKAFWSYIKNNSKSKQSIPDIRDNTGIMVSSSKLKAEVFNDAFTKVFSKVDVSFVPTVVDSKTDHVIIDSVEFDELLIINYFKGLDISKSCGPDHIHSRVLKETADEIGPVVSLLFNKLLMDGTVPESWRKAEVVPLFKKGDKSTPLNYRPISLTSILCKAMEKFIKDKIYTHLENNNLIKNQQHGFRSGRSCVTQLIEVINQWTSWLDQGLPFDCVYFDFQKAFDKISHSKLIFKLQSYGISGNLLNWIKEFLSNREQRVNVNGVSSGWRKVTSGVPQGSVLGPLLFIIFINDAPDIISDSYIKLFADDTKLFRVVQSESDRDSLQADINALYKWSLQWQLPFNLNKCKLMHFGFNNANFDYSIGETDSRMFIQTVTEETDLGIVVDNKLSFSAHASKVARAANKRLGLITRAFKHLDSAGYMCLYKSMVRPIMEYGGSAWTPRYQRDSDLLEHVQQRSTRLVSELKGKDYVCRLKDLNLPTLAYRRKRNDIIQTYKILHKIDSIDSIFNISSVSRTRGHSLKLYKSKPRLDIRKKSFAVRVINDWNSLPEHIVSAPSINCLKSGLEKSWSGHHLKFRPYFTEEMSSFIHEGQTSILL